MLRNLAPSLSVLAVLAACLALAASCTKKPKVARAGVGEPTPTSSPTTKGSGADGSGTGGGNTSPTLSSPSPSPTAVPSATAGNTTGNTPGNTPGNPAPEAPANGAGNGADNTAGSSSNALAPPADLPSAQAESELSRQECDKGNAVACMRLGAYFKSAGRREDAKRAYLNACVKATTIAAGTVCKVEADPLKSNARGCYEAGLMLVFDGDKAAAKVALQCACDKSFSVACADAKAL